MLTLLILLLFTNRSCSALLEKGRLWRDWRASHEEVLQGRSDEDVLRALYDWLLLMNMPKSSTVVPEYFRGVPSSEGNCIDDHEATLGIFGYGCGACKSIHLCMQESREPIQSCRLAHPLYGIL